MLVSDLTCEGESWVQTQYKIFLRCRSCRHNLVFQSQSTSMCMWEWPWHRRFQNLRKSVWLLAICSRSWWKQNLSILYSTVPSEQCTFQTTVKKSPDKKQRCEMCVLTSLNISLSRLKNGHAGFCSVSDLKLWEDLGSVEKKCNTKQNRSMSREMTFPK